MTAGGPASTAQCLYCFEVLSAHFEGRREPPSLAEVERLYAEYEGANGQKPGGSSSSSSSSSGGGGGSNEVSSLPASTSTSSAYPVYVTWNTLSPGRRGASGSNKALRGCIGTFEPLPLERGLRTYALVSALEDYRFSPIAAALLPQLGCELTLLSDFEDCGGEVDRWQVGKHGLKISFVSKGRRMGATYLPHVCPEQGWSKEECFESLMYKAGWEPLSSASASSSSASASGKVPPVKPWHTVSDLKVVRYQGSHAQADYAQWKEWRTWAKGRI